MVWVLFAFFGLVAMLAYILDWRLCRQRQLSQTSVARETNAQKLFASKTVDSAFFDGEDPDYAEAYRRIRQNAGA